MKTLTQQHGIGVFNRTNAEWDINALSNGWEEVTTGSFVSSTYFDLAGMSMDDKTLFFEAAGVQDVLNPVCFNPNPGDSLIVLNLMTSTPLTNVEAVNFSLYGNFPGPAKITFSETIYARIQQFVVNADTGPYTGMTLNSEHQLGSLEPTASDRVYSYKVIVFGTPFGGTRVDLTPTRHILRAKAEEEPDHQYIMRLLRSYELQQEPDVD